MARNGRFRLWKYYLDCVAEDGSACIGYVARLRWGPLSISYAALLECDGDGARRERHSYARVPEPVLAGEEVTWECAPLRVFGTWSGVAVWPRTTLLDGADGSIHWQVIAPRAAARVSRDGAAPVVGWGYVERLELNIEPWRLPFETLYWGRFHSPRDALVWIGWEGDVRLRHIRHNDEQLADAGFGEAVLRFDPGRALELTDRCTIHDAPVVGAINRLPRVLQRVPPSFLAAREVKWLSRARLSTWSGPPVSGWALHERVQFR